jgi:hypothetical protein
LISVLGLDDHTPCTFGAWLATRVTSCAPLLESPGILTALDRVALHAVGEPCGPLRPAHEDASFWQRYPLAVPAVVAALRQACGPALPDVQPR